jgi:hypothetical protein
MKHCISLLSLILVVILTLSLVSCGQSAAPAVDVAALCDEMLSADSFPEMLNIRSGDSREERGFSAISDMDYEKVEAFSLYYAADGTSYELAVICLKDAADMKALEKSLDAHIHTRVEQYRSYDATQVMRAENAVVAVSGRCAALIMCDEPSAVKAVFDRAVQS